MTVFDDDILAPRDNVVVRFNGKNPVVTMMIVTKVIRDVLKVTTKDVLETDVRWDAISPENREFYGRWAGNRTEDQWTKTNVRIIIQGMQNAKERTGWVRIEIKGKISTDVDLDNFMQRIFWWFYSRTFYNKQRQKYLEQAKDDIHEMRMVFQRTLGITPD